MMYQTQQKLCLECSTFIESDSYPNKIISYFCNSCAEKIACRRLFMHAYIRRFKRYNDVIQSSEPNAFD